MDGWMDENLAYIYPVLYLSCVNASCSTSTNRRLQKEQDLRSVLRRFNEDESVGIPGELEMLAPFLLVPLSAAQSVITRNVHEWPAHMHS